MAWPPTLDALKSDINAYDDSNDGVLQDMLDAAIAFVSRVHAGRYSFPDDSGVDESGDLPLPPGDMVLGAVRLARRWYERRRSPDALVSMGELGSARVPSFDIDIDRMLQIGSFAPPVFA